MSLVLEAATSRDVLNEPHGLENQRVGTTVHCILPPSKARGIIETTFTEGPKQTSDLLIQQLRFMQIRLCEPLTDEERLRMAAILDAEIGILARNIGDYRRLLTVSENVADGHAIPVQRKPDCFVVDLDQIH